MSIIGSNILAGSSGQGGAYEIEQSLRFDGSSGYLNWTPSSAGDRTLWTWSAWIKRSGLSSTVGLFGSYAAANNTDYLEILFASGNTLLVQGNSTAFLNTTQVFRDTSAWYHIVIAVDTSNATADDRIKIYVNGEQVTDFGTRNNPSSGGNLGVNQAGVHRLGRRPNSTDYFNGYMAEVNFIDGSALNQFDFGELDDNGVWRPKRYTGSYTGNSFYLKFASGDGTDDSGLSNTWTANNFTTSGTGTDVMSDTPTTNYGTFNPVAPSALALSEGNLSLSFTNSSNETISSPVTMGAASGKFYVEFKYTASTSGASTGAGVFDLGTETDLEGYVTGWSRIIYDQRGVARKDNSNVATGLATTRTAGDILGIAVDCDAGEVRFYVNGTLQHTETGLSYSAYGFHFEPNIGGSNNACTVAFNGGQRAFEQTVPSGYKALNTSNLPAPDIADPATAFDLVTYQGTGTTNTLTVDFSPNFAWIKRYDGTGNNILVDTLRGATPPARLISDSTARENNASDGVNSFSSTGVVLDGTGGGGGDVNQTTRNYWAAQWDGNGTGSSNTSGSITSTVSANPTAGFSIVTYTGNGTDKATIGHGLGVAPKMVIVKIRSQDYRWMVYFQGFTNDLQTLVLDTAAGVSSLVNPAWSTDDTTSSVFGLGNNADTNASGETFVAYCFAEVEGYSKISTYEGNGSPTDGPFVYLGFKPKFIIFKGIDSGSRQWNIMNSERIPYNGTYARTVAESNLSESAMADSAAAIDILSNGFKVLANSSATNASNETYMYYAVAENPFGGSGVSPATAR